ncbi:MAG: alpha/beta hydrolase [Pseudomonadota bacterium]
MTHPSPMQNVPKVLATLVATLTLSCLAPLVQAAGLQFIEVPADSQGPALKGAVWTPCSAPAVEIKLGPMVLPGVQNCAVKGINLPLVVVSHGSGGSFLGHHDTAASLADAGFVVAAINHPGDNFQDLSRQGHLSAFLTRPVDMKNLVDFMTAQWPQRDSLDKQQIGFFGFSRGGYTGLVAAGAVPDFRIGAGFCGHVDLPLCQEARSKDLPKPPPRDARIKAAVIADPLSLFAAPGLATVGIPIQLWSSELGGDGVTLQSVELIRAALPTLAEYHLAKGAGHFAYLAPCSPERTRAIPAICKDNPGFDRVAFHTHFNAKVLAFFRAHLKQGSAP